MNWLKKLLSLNADDGKVTSMESPAVPKAQTQELRQGSPEFDAFIANTTLESGGDLVHGAQHLAALLELDPARPDWRALIVRYAAAAGADTGTLISEQEERFASTEALRAYLWNLEGRRVDAIALLVEVSKAIQTLRYLHAWALEWLEGEGAVECLDEESAMNLFGAILMLSEEAHLASVTALRAARRWAQLLERAATKFESTPLWIMIRAGLQRKAGNFDGAIAITGGIESAASFSHAVAIGLVNRRKGMFAESEAAFVRALAFEPENISGMLEAGDTCFEAQSWESALGWYTGALALEPEQPWATPSGCYCRFKLTGDSAFIDQLAASAQAGNQRAHQLWFMEVGALPESRDASANVLRQFRDQFNHAAPDTAGIKSLGLSTLEAPSNRLALSLELAARKLDPLAEFTVGGVPKPDPRLPMAEVAHCLWRYEGTTPLPALPPPPAAILDAIVELAECPFDPVANWAQASHVADRLGSAHVAQILAVMVHPAPLPAGRNALQWLPRLQLAAAQVVGQIDGGWEHSERRKALLSLLLGPADWTTCAAIRVMGWIARAEPAHALGIHASFGQLEHFLPDEGHWDWIPELYEQWQAIPYLFDSEREALQRKLADWDAAAYD